MRFAITFTVDATSAGRPLAEWLVYMLLDETEGRIVAAVAEGRVTVDGVAATDAATRLTAGAEVKYTEAPSTPG